MCGFVGMFDTKGARAIDRSLLSRMNDSLAHRGPDGDGIYVAGGIGLGHRRLAIIDLAAGAQPMFNEDGTVVVVYNGEIYNFQELADRLIALGHRFRTRCDTEVIVHAWEEWGENCVEQFRGMFAFALWDENAETLFLARDRLGIKPLYYALLPDGTLSFGSELKALLVDPRLVREIDPLAVEEYFAYGYVPDPRSIYKSVRKLPPGHLLTWRRGGDVLLPKQYWDLDFTARVAGDETEIGEELIERLREAIEIRLISEVPLGAFLSGGVDSSAVVALMAGLSNNPINTCSIGFGDPAFDESRFAAQIAAQFDTNHSVRRVDPDAFDLVDSLATFYDEPFADSSAMPTYRVCALAREKVTVALSGDGGDETFAGYSRHRWHSSEERIRSCLPDAVRRPVFGMLGQLYPKMNWAPKFLRAKSTIQSIARDSIGGYFHSVSMLQDGRRRSLFSPKFQSELQGYHASEVLARHMKQAPVDDPLSRIQYADFKTYLPGDILTKVDRASMANSLEVRVPILDHKFIEWAAGIPVGMKLKGREGKYIFKKSLESNLPRDILYRRKMGFAVPLGAWFRGPLKDRLNDALNSPMLADTGMFDLAYLGDLFHRHQSGAAENSSPLWSLLMFESFLRNVHNAPSKSAISATLEKT